MNKEKDVIQGIESEETTFKGWKAVRLRMGDLELHVTPGIGGRVNSCVFKGHELFYTQPEFEGVTVPRPADLTTLKEIKRSQGFRYYGGYKTWLAPQEGWPEEIPYLDLDAGAYEWELDRTDRSVRMRMKSPVCRESGVELTKEIVLYGDAAYINILQAMKNYSDKPVEFGLWDVSQLLRPAKVFIPFKREGSAFPGGIKIFCAAGNDEAAVHSRIERNGGYLTVRCEDSHLFKIGTDSDEGWIAGFFPRPGGGWTVFQKKFEVFPDTRFGHGCSCEIFNSDERPHLEMEIHSPMARLMPGARMTWMNQWSFAQVEKLPESSDELGMILNRI